MEGAFRLSSAGEGGPSFRSVVQTAAVGAGAGIIVGIAIFHAPLTLAILGAGGGAYAAQRTDSVGDVARMSGEKVGSVASAATRTIGSGIDHAKKIDSEYGISSTTAAVANRAVETVKTGVGYVRGVHPERGGDDAEKEPALAYDDEVFGDADGDAI